MSLVVVGSMAFDAIETPFGKSDKIIGGAATYIAWCASNFTPVKQISVERLKHMLLTWDHDNSEVQKIDMADLQYPILIFVNDEGNILSIIDGHHRAQKAVRRGLETIKCKLIPINSLPKDVRKVFKHIN